MGSMKCVIPGVHLKVFGRAIQSLSKIGDELYFEPLDEGLSLRTVNSSRSAYACFQFAPNFFITYITGCGKDGGRSSDGEGLRCKLTMKSVMSVFRSLPTIDKSVEKCKITFDMQEDKLIFQMCCRHGIVKTHNLSFMDCETLQAIFSRDLCPNKLTAGPKLLCDAVLNFQAHQEEVVLMLRPDFVALKNYVEDEPNPSRVVHTELTLSPDEFDCFQVGVDTDVTFCLKEFRAILAFADLANLPINLHIESPGKPVTFSITSDLSFEANFVLATLASADDVPDQSQADINRCNGKAHSSKRPQDTHRKQNSTHPKKSSHHLSSHSQRKSLLTDAGDNDDDDEEMAMMDISDTTILEPHSKGPSRSNVKQVQITNKISNSDKDRVILNRPAVDQSESLSDNNVPVRHHKKSSDTISDGRLSLQSTNEMARKEPGFYVSASEDSQSQQEMERGRGEKLISRNLTDVDGGDDGDEMSQIIPIRNYSTAMDITFSNQSDAKDKDSNDDDNDEEDETICATPPSKRFRSLFFNTQSSTQSTIATQNKPAVLCPDSDSDG